MNSMDIIGTQMNVITRGVRTNNYEGVGDSIQVLLDYVEQKNHVDLDETIAQNASFVQTWLSENKEKLP